MQFQIYEILKKEKIKNKVTTFLKHVQNFPFQEGKHGIKKAGEYCWVITLVVGWSRCGRPYSSVLEFQFQLDTTAYTYTVEHMHNQFCLAQN